MDPTGKAADLVDKMSEWWCLLNLHKWPNDLPLHPPDDWGNCKSTHPTAINLMDFIKSAVGKEPCLRKWNEEFIDR